MDANGKGDHFKIQVFIWINLSTFNNSFLLRVNHVNVITLAACRVGIHKQKGKWGTMEKVPVLNRGIPRKGGAGSMASRAWQASGDSSREKMP